jgi:hypothetical protein
MSPEQQTAIKIIQVIRIGIAKLSEVGRSNELEAVVSKAVDRGATMRDIVNIGGRAALKTLEILIIEEFLLVDELEGNSSGSDYKASSN